MTHPAPDRGSSRGPDRREPDRSRWIPLGLAAVVVVAGLALGLRGREAAQDVAPTASPPLPAPTTEAAPPAPTPEYEPDLSGPDVGELIVAGASDAHGLDARGGRLVWMTTERATLARARYDGGDLLVLYETDDADRFGGGFARDDRGVFFSVSGGDEPEPIFFLSNEALSTKAADLEPIAHGRAPDCFVATGTSFAWADLGVVRRMTPGGRPVELAQRAGRVVTMTAAGDDLVWIEAPLEGAGGHAIVRVPLRGGEAEIVTRLAPADRDTLASDGEFVFFSESEGGRHRVMRLLLGGGDPIAVAPTGLVTALAMGGGRVHWAERHGEEAPISLIRSAPTAEGAEAEPTRHGRHAGVITALTIADDHLFFSSSAGLYRLER